MNGTETSKRARVQHLGLETVTSIHRRLGVTRQTISHAISTGRLPAYVTHTDNDQRVIYLVKPSDADALWGQLSIDPELAFA